ncbi:type III pantothenate kinase [Aestuariivivens sediminis]|uniref:type III pantothenate kinase n=1 Tax=Aestuariivivens sediminis TaxID=2913557 RepID=UPI001F587672|nr:type III pantothenate kinase [Aestuariivivens sediminis]
MNLIIDIGNSLVKLAVFNHDELVFKTLVERSGFVDTLETVKRDYPGIQNAIVSSVATLDDDQVARLEADFKILKLDHHTSLPFKNAYKTPKTLGMDRLGLVSASVFHYPNTNVLIIDAGTCITYDCITAQNSYVGGAISPGIRMRYKALSTFTANLPLLDTEMPDALTGDTTKAAIHAGVIYGVLNEIDGVIETYRQKYANLTVILTGGDAKFLSKQLKSSIFANSNFLLEGLNYILQFNSF